MMQPVTFKKVIFTVLVCLFCTASWATPKESSVIVEIDTKDLPLDSVENVIADPIEVLLGSLEGVLLVSAKYSTNKAVIDVRFSEDTTDADTFVKRVRELIDTYLGKLPDSIESISVSQGESSEPLDPIVKPLPKSPLKTSPTPEKILDEPGVIRNVEKRSMSGRFLGSIESSNEFLPIITTLTSVSNINNNADKGKYFMSEIDGIVTGELTDCYNSTGNILTCQWRDKYGMGGVDFMFTPDYSSFNGRWSISGKEGAYKWSGRKVKDK
jgi:hypothetical protein